MLFFFLISMDITPNIFVRSSSKYVKHFLSNLYFKSFFTIFLAEKQVFVAKKHTVSEKHGCTSKWGFTAFSFQS